MNCSNLIAKINLLKTLILFIYKYIISLYENEHSLKERMLIHFNTSNVSIY